MFDGGLAVGSSALTALICLYANEIGKVLGVIDRPDGRRKHHATPTPLVGGLAVLLPFLLLVTVYQFSGNALPVHTAVLIVAGGFTVLGYLDDRQDLSPKLRLLAGILLIGAAVSLESSHVIRVLDFGEAKVVFSDIVGLAFTILVVLGLINAVNMADGMNGIVTGSALIWAVCLAVYAPSALLPLTLALSVLLAVVLAFNLRGKLFLGDAGAYGLGALLSILTIYVYNRTGALTADIVIAWFIVPVVDCLRLMASRAFRGGSPLRPDCDHLHHRLGTLMPSGRVFLVYWGMIGIPSVGVMAAPEWSGYFIAAIVACYGGIIALTSARFTGLSGRGKNLRRALRNRERGSVRGIAAGEPRRWMELNW